MDPGSWSRAGGGGGLRVVVVRASHKGWGALGFQKGFGHARWCWSRKVILVTHGGDGHRWCCWSRMVLMVTQCGVGHAGC